MKAAVIAVVCLSVTTCVGYRIDTCGYDKAQISETQATTLTCTGITNDQMVWKVTLTNCTSRQIGTCSWSKGKGFCSETDRDYKLTRTRYGRSELTVRRNHRTKIAGTVECAGLEGASLVDPDTCYVRVVYTDYNTASCSADVDTERWTVSGHCYLQPVYASDGVYSCQWKHISPVGDQTSFFTGTGMIMVPFGTDHTLYRASCSFRDHPMPTADGSHSYVMRFDPREYGNRVMTGPVLKIRSPKGPPVLHNCPSYVVEGDSDTCTCNASASDPPALTTWYTNTRTNKVLEMKNVRRGNDGRKYTCFQSWGGVGRKQKRHTPYTLHVKYPPSSSPVITGIKDDYPDGDTVSLSCRVTGGNPPVTSVDFSCASHGDREDTISRENGETVVTSTIDLNSVTTRDNGTLCLCYATWETRPSLYTTTSTVTITVLYKSDHSMVETPASSTTIDGGTPSENNDDDGDNDDNKEVIIGGTVGGVAGVIIIVFVIVIAVVCKRRCEPLYAKTAPCHEDDHTYTNLDYSVPISAPAPVVTQREDEVVDQHLYENTAEIQRQTSL